MCSHIVDQTAVTSLYSIFLCFFFNDTATTEIYTLSLHDALPIFCTIVGGHIPPLQVRRQFNVHFKKAPVPPHVLAWRWCEDRKSTRLNSSHTVISYAVFCLKKKREKD